MTDDEYKDLNRRRAAIIYLKGRNPLTSFFDDWNDHWLSDALAYGDDDLTPGCKATIERVQADRFEWRKPTAKTLSLHRIGLCIAALSLIVAAGSLMLKIAG